ncbi:MAG: hypothetical protein K6A42_10640 [Treponema sp.]|nr:hypothetical protein [Treponema sp.]
MFLIARPGKIILLFCADPAEKELPKKSSTKVLTFLSVLFFITLYAFGAILPVNCVFDKSKPETFSTKILGQNVSHGKTTKYYFDVASWPKTEGKKKQISVGKGLYEKKKVGDQLTIKIYKGALGLPWYRPSLDE